MKAGEAVETIRHLLDESKEWKAPPTMEQLMEGVKEIVDTHDRSIETGIKDADGRPIRYGDTVETKYERRELGDGEYVPFWGTVFDPSTAVFGGGHWSYEEHGCMEPRGKFVHVASSDGFYGGYHGYEVVVVDQEK